MLFMFFPHAIQIKILDYVRSFISHFSKNKTPRECMFGCCFKYKAFFENTFFFCKHLSGIGEYGAVVVHIVIESLRCVEDMEFYI